MKPRNRSTLKIKKKPKYAKLPSRPKTLLLTEGAELSFPEKPLPRTKEEIGEITKALARALSDPEDDRTDVQLAFDFQIPLQDLRALKDNPEFFEPVLQEFHRNLRRLTPVIVKKLVMWAKDGSITSSKLLLEINKVIGTQINLSLPGNGDFSVSSRIRGLSDIDLDRTIHRLISDGYPDDLIFQAGEVQLAEAMDVGIQEVSCGPVDPGRSDSPRTSGEVSDALVRESEENE